MEDFRSDQDAFTLWVRLGLQQGFALPNDLPVELKVLIDALPSQD